MPSTPPYKAHLIVAPSKAEVPDQLHLPVISACKKALARSGSESVFTIALSGGSLPAQLGTLSESFDKAGVNPQWDKWYVLLADERCVPSSDGDSNLGAIRTSFLDKVGIPEDQVYGIDESLLSDANDSTEKIAVAYEAIVDTVLARSGGALDLAVLGFGPDGHTCSLFPDHPLLSETERQVAPILDSPKPPPKRITLTFPVLNERTGSIIFCGAGKSKGPILRAVLADVAEATETTAGAIAPRMVTYADPPPYPCGMVRPKSLNLSWVVDADAVEELGL